MQQSITPELKKVLGKYERFPEFIGLTLTDPNQPGAVDNTALHVASSLGDISDIEILLAHGAEINMKGDLGFTALHFAALKGQATATEKLLSLGADPKALNEFMQTPSEVADLGGHHDISETINGWQPAGSN